MGFEVFDKDIKMGLKPVYLFHGQERYLIDQYIEKMIEVYVPETYRDFNLVTFDGEKSSLDEILDACETLPFFSECKIILVKNTTYFRNKKANLSISEEKRLLAYYENPSESSHLFFISNHAIDKRKKVVKSLDKCGRIIEFSKLSAQIFPRWVHKKIKQTGKDISSEMLRYLIERLSYIDKNSTKTLLDVDNEIKMICSSINDLEVTEESINDFVKKPLDADIFMMVDAVGNKRAESAIRIMHELIKNGQPIQVIFTMISRQFRLLKKVKMLVKEGYNQGSIAKLLGVHPYALKNIMKQVHMFNEKQLTIILDQCSRIDYQSKSTAIDFNLAIETLIVECSFVI